MPTFHHGVRGSSRLARPTLCGVRPCTRCGVMREVRQAHRLADLCRDCRYTDPDVWTPAKHERAAC